MLISNDLLKNAKLRHVETKDKSQPVITDGREAQHYYRNLLLLSLLSLLLLSRIFGHVSTYHFD